MENLNIVFFSTSEKKEFSHDTVQFLADKAKVSFEEIVKTYNLVQVVKVAVYGTLRYNDSAYGWFKQDLAYPSPIYTEITGYHKVWLNAQHQYFAAEPCPEGILDVQLFYVFAESIDRLDNYEGVSSGLYERVWVEDIGCYLYVRGPNHE